MRLNFEGGNSTEKRSFRRLTSRRMAIAQEEAVNEACRLVAPRPPGFLGDCIPSNGRYRPRRKRKPVRQKPPGFLRHRETEGRHGPNRFNKEL